MKQLSFSHKQSSPTRATFKKTIQRIEKRPTGFIFYSVGRFCIRWNIKLFQSRRCGIILSLSA
jgi:hypothetical protein